VLLRRAREQGAEFDARWRYFSLTQVNSKVDGWTVWDAPADEPVPGRLAFQAAEAARRQDAFERHQRPLLDARHRDRRDLGEREVVLDVARRAGLDLERFERDLDDPTTLQALAGDHQEAVSAHGVFGTPTLVFENGNAAYLRLRPAPEGTKALEAFDELMRLISNEPYVLEIKRPTAPLASPGAATSPPSAEETSN
jgi:protein-disulfide isomerase-like protein with CxxC motif